MNNKNLIISVLFVLMSTAFYAQNYQISYQKYNNGILDSTNLYSFVYMDSIAYLSVEEDINKEFIDYKKKANVELMVYGDTRYKTLQNFSEMALPSMTEEVDTLLDLPCKKAIYQAFSNTIEVWYTLETVAKGSPYKAYLPENSLALKIIINGSRMILASEIQKLEDKPLLTYFFDEAQQITKARARELQITSRFTNLSVFTKEQINFETTILNPPPNQSGITYRYSNGTVILKKIQLPEIHKKGASIFATLTNWSNGDAYDRTGTIFTLSEKKAKSMLDALQNGLDELPVVTDNLGKHYQGFTSTMEYEVPVELMRFFTSFGVSHFNKIREIENYPWQDSVVYKQEITSLIPNHQDEIWIGVFIGNYDRGGHQVSLDLQFYPPWGEQKVPEKYIQPLFNTVNIMEMSGQNYGRLFRYDTLEMDFEIPENISGLEMFFTTTGHGGWGGGDEFNPKLNQIFVDDELVFSHIPWRTDCGTYRMSNPASGNFQNGLSSSDLSRSNWCPATLTPPFRINMSRLLPGKHHVHVVIDQGEEEGNSFSSWCISGVLVGERISN